MSTPLHDSDALRALAEGPAGPARDWACVHLAARGVDAGLPDDPEAAAVALAAGASPDPIRARLPAPGRAAGASLAPLLVSVARMGALPADGGPWLEPLAAAVRGRGSPSDAAVAFLLSALGHHDPAVVAAAARVEEGPTVGLLPAVVLSFAAARGADLAALAASIAAPLAARAARHSPLLSEALAGLGVPRVLPERVPTTLEQALFVGGTLAGVDETPPVSPGRGAARRRMQQAAAELLDGLPGPAPALVRALLRHDAADTGALLAAATWLRAAPETDPLAAVLDHGAGEAPAVLAAAAAGRPDPATLNVSLAVAFQADPPPAILAARALARGSPDRDLLVSGFEARAVAALDEPRLQAALAVAVARDPGPVLRWLAIPGLRGLGLYHARHTAHEEVLTALLDEASAPENPAHAGLLASALAAQGDAAALRALERLEADAGDDRFDADLARARSILGVVAG